MILEEMRYKGLVKIKKSFGHRLHPSYLFDRDVEPLDRKGFIVCVQVSKRDLTPLPLQFYQPLALPLLGLGAHYVLDILK